MPEEGPLLVDTGSGLSVRYRGRNLYSPSSPVAAAERRVAVAKIQPQTLLFVPSPLLFHGFSKLLESLPEQVHLLCVESDQALMKLSRELAPRTILDDARITYLRTESTDEVLRAAHDIGIGRYRRAQEITLNAGRSLNRPLYDHMYRALEYEVRSHWRNRMTLMQLSHLWLKNFFRNFLTVAGAPSLSDLAIERPIVVAGAGESLEDALKLLAPHRNEYYLLAVDTAVGSVEGLGLRPDAVIVLDAQAANLKDLIGAQTDGVSLVADITAYPGCLRRFAGNAWFFFSEFARLGLFDRARAAGLLPTGVPPLGSVGIAALYCALTMTRAPVLFAGLDFSFRPGKSHARGAPAHVAGLLRGERLCRSPMYNASIERPHREAKGKLGDSVWTDGVLEGYNTALRLLLSRHDRVFDLGRFGLPTGAPLIADAAELRRLLRGWRPQAHSQAAAPSNTLSTDVDRRAKRLDRAASFLRAEHRRLIDGVEATLRALGRGSIGGKADSALAQTVRSLDFVYLHFPDWSEAPSLTEGFLKRFVEAAETRVEWIEQALSALPHIDTRGRGEHEVHSESSALPPS